MTKTINYKPTGVCSREINITIEDDIVKDVHYIGGCSGNTQGVARLAAGMRIDDVIEKLADIRCGFKNTSCPAQLAKALREYKEKQ